jgi:hypothetical protein
LLFTPPAFGQYRRQIGPTRRARWWRWCRACHDGTDELPTHCLARCLVEIALPGEELPTGHREVVTETGQIE